MAATRMPIAIPAIHVHSRDKRGSDAREQWFVSMLLGTTLLVSAELASAQTVIS
jgi:hypothetical protein